MIRVESTAGKYHTARKKVFGLELRVQHQSQRKAGHALQNGGADGVDKRIPDADQHALVLEQADVVVKPDKGLAARVQIVPVGKALENGADGRV